MIVAKRHADALRVACHIEMATDFRNALAAGIDEIAHLPGYDVDPAYPELVSNHGTRRPRCRPPGFERSAPI